MRTPPLRVHSSDLSDSYFSPLRIEQVAGTSGGRQRWRLTEPLVMRLKLGGGFLKIFVPEGTETDFASVPRLLWPLVPPTGPWCVAAVIHDFLCTLGGCSRFLADAIFREAMALSAVPISRRVPMYYAVRLYSVWRAVKDLLTTAILKGGRG